MFMENRITEEVLVRSYFTATTGYTTIYSTMGFAGMYAYQLYLNVITLAGISISRKQRNTNRRTVFYSIACLIYVFLFFTNTLYFVGTSLVLWIPIFGMLIKKKPVKIVK